jgi:hypothetical protein
MATLAAEVVPFATAAVGMYGRAVLAKAWDNVADATIKTGTRVLQAIFGQKKDGEELPVVIAEVIDNPGDEDYVNALKLKIRKALEADVALARDIAAIVAEARPNVTVNQHVVAGRDAYNAGRDMNINRRPD